MADLDPGMQYFAAVKMTDKEGYESRLSTVINLPVVSITPEELVVERSNVVEVFVIMILILVIMGVGLGYYIVRHRKLQRNFQEFASHYSPAGGGAASIFNHNLLDADGSGGGDDDDMNPIIRGFSDSEPLVVS